MNFEAKRRSEVFFRECLNRAPGEAFQGKGGPCPYCEDKSPSAGAFCDSEGIWRFRCQSGHVCPTRHDNLDCFDLISLNENIPLDQVLREHRQMDHANGEKSTSEPVNFQPPKPPENVKVFATLADLKKSVKNLAECYRYLSADREEISAVLRIEPGYGGKSKTFFQCHKTSAGWVMKKLPGKHPLFNLPTIYAEPSLPVVVVEGEKCVVALHHLGGVVATSAVGGCGCATKLTDWSPLAGRSVVLWPDNDDGGRELMQRVAAELDGVAASIQIVDIDALDLPAKCDVVDYLEKHEGTEAKANALIDAMSFSKLSKKNAFAELEEYLGKIKSGELYCEDYPFDRLNTMAAPAILGSFTLICGVGGSRKSFLGLQLLEHFFECDKQNEKKQDSTAKVSNPFCYMLEEDRNFHSMRLLAQKSKVPQLANPNWVKKNPDSAHDIVCAFEDWISDIGDRVFVSTDKVVTHKSMLQWIETSAKAGGKIFIIDPITAIQGEGDVWTADLKFLMSIRSLMCVYPIHVIFITHPKNNNAKPSLSNMAGGQAYARFTQCVLWLASNNPPASKYVTVGLGDGATQSVDGEITILKARNGVGVGATIAYTFDSETLKFSELGVIENEQN